MNLKKNTISPHLLIGSFTLICLTPFIGKAFHIDDPMYIWAAQQILTNSTDFYGFNVNWYGYQQPMYMVNQNPPLTSYFIAFFAFFFGLSEPALHISFLIPAVLTSLGIYKLTVFFTPKSYTATFIAISSPVFLVSSSNIMSDVLMISFYIWAVVFWLSGIKSNKYTYLFIAAIFILLASLTKYFAISLIPLLLTYTLIKKKKFTFQLLFLVIPILGLIAYQLITYLLYDNLLITNAASYAIKIGSQNQAYSYLRQTLKGLSYLGGCLFGVVFFAHLMWSKKQIIISISILLFIILLLIIAPEIREFLIPESKENIHSITFHYVVFAFTGGMIMLLSVINLIKNKNAESWLLFLWLWGTFFFTTYINWTISARNILPTILIVGLLVLIRIREQNQTNNSPPKYQIVIPLTFALILSLSITWADTQLANTQRIAAFNIYKKFEQYPHTIWFEGHWGFQFYMEKFRANAVDFNNTKVIYNDILIIPTNNTNTHLPTNKYIHLVDNLQLNYSNGIGTMTRKNAAGFYWGGYGPLPFAIGNIAPENYLIYIVGDFKNAQQAKIHYKKLLDLHQ